MLRANDYDTPFAPGTLIYHNGVYADHVGFLVLDNAAPSFAVDLNQHGFLR